MHTNKSIRQINSNQNVASRIVVSLTTRQWIAYHAKGHWRSTTCQDFSHTRSKRGTITSRASSSAPSEIRSQWRNGAYQTTVATQFSERLMKFYIRCDGDKQPSAWLTPAPQTSLAEWINVTAIRRLHRLMTCLCVFPSFTGRHDCLIHIHMLVTGSPAPSIITVGYRTLLTYQSIWDAHRGDISYFIS